MEKYLGIEIDLSLDDLLPEQGLKLLQAFYCLPHEHSPQMAYARAATCYCFGDYELAQRIYNYVSKNWFMFASPVLSNAIEIDWSKAPAYYWDVIKHKNNDDHKQYTDWCQWFENVRRGKKSGLNISCYLTYVPDTIKGLLDHTTEERLLSVNGGGVGGHWSEVRSVSDKAPGPIPFIKTVDSDMVAYRQGKTRKGSYAAYLNVSHPEIMEFITIRVPTGADQNRKCLNLNNAVNITDAFLDAVLNDLEWKLIDPADATTRQVVSARKLWEQILDTRNRTGEPYIHFIDESNRKLPQHLKDLGLKVNGSNLCTEITLPTSEERTAVCCLSSTNVEKYDEWKNTRMVSDLVRFLDDALEFFILTAPPELYKAVYSASRERSIGLGFMGFHSYLQSKNVPWESAMAKSLNLSMFKHIRKQAEEGNELLTKERGSCPDASDNGYATRLSHLLAGAPNSNSAMLVGTSPATEPNSSNAFVQESRVGSYLQRNKYLETILEKYAKENAKDAHWLFEQWRSIEGNDGSCQHLEYLDEYTRAVFKTAYEIDQRWIIDHARDRQEFIDQAQSVNLFFKSQPDKGYVNQVHLRAFLPSSAVTGVPLKSLYYFRTKPLKQANKISQPIERMALKDGVVEETECLSCQG